MHAVALFELLFLNGMLKNDRNYLNIALTLFPFNHRGEDIFISVWNLHHSPNHWVEADTFNPERWPLDGPNPNETNQNFRSVIEFYL